MKKSLSVIVGAMALVLGGTAQAESLLDFCVNAKPYYATASNAESLSGCTGVGSQAGQTGFVADVVAGSYNEKVLGVSDGFGGVDFQSTTVFNFNVFRRNEGGTAYEALDTGIGVGYQLYAVITATGSVTGGTSFSADSAQLSLYLNSDMAIGNRTDLSMDSIDDTTLAFTGDNAAPDLLLATAVALDFGTGTTGSSGGTDGFAVQFSDFTLAMPDGDAFFIRPRPFHLIVYADGSILDGTVTSELTAVGQLIEFNGTGDARFVVPEPGSLALVGLSLLALGGVLRRKGGKQV